MFVRRSKSVRQNSTQSESSPTHFRSSITFSPTPGRISRYQSQHDSRHQLGRLSQRSIARQLSSQDSYLEIPTRKQMKEWDKNIPEVCISVCVAELSIMHIIVPTYIYICICGGANCNIVNLYSSPWYVRTHVL